MPARRWTPLALALAAGAASLEAQDLAPARGGSVAGTVLAAATGAPLPGAVVVLEASADAALVTPAASGGAFLGRALTAVTDAAGRYRFTDLPPGAYRLLVRHLGFHPALVHVDLARSEPFRVSVALLVNPIRLEPMDARAITAEPYARARGAADEARVGRLDAEQFRDVRFLEGDASVLTHADVVEAVTLGETDLFRAIQRLPGVSARDDFTAGLWTRGAPWGQTRVYFDGLPLFNPVHVIGVFSGVNPDAVGTASFHPGARSSAIGEGAAGVLDVGSRRPTRPGLHGMSEVSVVSARAAADWASPSGRVAAMVAARRSYLDLLTRFAESLGADSGTHIPYAFFDLTGRFDADLGRGASLEASGVWAQDDVRGDVRGLLRQTTGRWGNRAGRVSLAVPLGGLRLRQTAGLSEFTGRLNADQLAATPIRDAPIHGPTRNGLRVVTVAQELAPAEAGGRPTWAAGLQYVLQRQDYLGQYPRPYPVVVLPDQLALNERLGLFALWAERRVGLGPSAALEAGLRAETHAAVRNAPALTLAPRLAARATPPGSRVTVSAAAARSFQYTQALAPAGPSVGPDLYVTDVWLLANDTIPAVRADIATLGAEAWLGGGWTVALNGYLRRATGVAVPEPAPGPLNNQRPILAVAENRARGLELSVRRLVGRWTASAAYTLARSDLRARSAFVANPAVWTYPSPADRRHAVDLTLLARLGDAWRVGGAFTAASGAPFSRFLLGVASCDSLLLCGPADSAALSIELPNGARSRGYASLDLLVEWTRPTGRVRWGAYLQVRNVLDLVNPVTYTGTLDQCGRPDPPLLVEVRPGVCDRFDRGLPRLPLAGLRLTF